LLLQVVFRQFALDAVNGLLCLARELGQSESSPHGAAVLAAQTGSADETQQAHVTATSK